MKQQIIPKEKNTTFIKCMTCGQILAQGQGAIMLLGQGIKIGCRKCGNEKIITETIFVVDNETSADTKQDENRFLIEKICN